MSSNIEQRVIQLRAASTFEEQAHQVRLSIWNQRHSLFDGRVPSDPMDLLEPGVALHMLGFKVVTDANLGEMVDAGRKVRVAGVIDQNRQIVRISPVPTYQEQRYTAGHELGHALLHPGMDGLHHDRVISGPSYRKEKHEREADQLASCFLMPAKLLLNRFAQRFGSAHFKISEDTIYGLRIPSIDQALRRFRCPRDISLAVATATTFMGTPFRSLSTSFRVSPTAMAIRLEEVGLIDEGSLTGVR
jgi:hypothetical protein